MLAASRFSSCPAEAQLPPQEVNSWGPTLRFWGPCPKTQRPWDSGNDLR